jgi:hypothetical protein
VDPLALVVLVVVLAVLPEDTAAPPFAELVLCPPVAVVLPVPLPVNNMLPPPVPQAAKPTIGAPTSSNARTCFMVMRAFQRGP